MSSDTRAEMLLAIKKANALMQAKQSEELRRIASGSATPNEPPTTPIGTFPAAAGGEDDGGPSGWELAVRPLSFSSVKSLNYISAKERRSDFFTVWGRKIELFIADPSKMTLGLPAELSPNDRRELHQLADKYNLSHHSEGVGRDRHLVLRKDELHFKAPSMAPTAEALEALKTQDPSPGSQVALVDASGYRGADDGRRPPFQKQNKYQLRRRTSPTKIEYDDETAEKAVRRLQRATDQYRDAADVGITTAELRGGVADVDALLADDAGAGSAANSSSALQWSRYLEGPSAPPGASAAPARSSIPSATTASSTSSSAKTYSEQCLTCATKVPVDFELDKWDCQGYCAKCRRETVWRLLDTTPTLTFSSSAPGGKKATAATKGVVASASKQTVIVAPKEEGTSSSGTGVVGGAKREREESSAAAVAQALERHPATRGRSEAAVKPEEIVRDDDDDDDASDLEEMSPEDAVGIAQMADMHELDVAWIQRFVEQQAATSLAPLAYRIRFCMDIHDLPNSRNFSPPSSSFLFCLIRQTTKTSDSDAKAEGAAEKQPALMSQVLESLQSLLGPDEAENKLVVAFETNGSGLCVCRVSGSAANGEVMEEIRKLYGARAVSFGPLLQPLLDAMKSTR